MQETQGEPLTLAAGTSAKFQWQEGYGAFSVSQSQRQAVIDYIANQVQHHQKRSFEDEFLGLLKNSGVPYDPRFGFGEDAAVPTALGFLGDRFPSVSRWARLLRPLRGLAV